MELMTITFLTQYLIKQIKLYPPDTKGECRCISLERKYLKEIERVQSVWHSF